MRLVVVDGISTIVKRTAPEPEVFARGRQASINCDGYLIAVSPFNGTVAISKDRFHIAYARSVEQAKATIDQLA